MIYYSILIEFHGKSWGYLLNFTNSVCKGALKTLLFYKIFCEYSNRILHIIYTLDFPTDSSVSIHCMIVSLESKNEDDFAQEQNNYKYPLPSFLFNWASVIFHRNCYKML